MKDEYAKDGLSYNISTLQCMYEYSIEYMKLMKPFEERGWNENTEYYEELNEMIE